MLRAIPSTLEVREALFSLHVDKSLGPDGFPTFFFQIYWQVVMDDVVKVV